MPMQRDEAQKVRCPVCSWFVAKITSLEAELEVNCVNWNCQTPLSILRENGRVTVVAVPKVKQA